MPGVMGDRSGGIIVPEEKLDNVVRALTVSNMSTAKTDRLLQCDDSCSIIR